MDIFSIRLKELRLEKGLTQKQLAHTLKTTDDSIFSWEKGRSQPPIETIRQLCIVLDTSADYLLGLEDETGAKTTPEKFF
ncbi:MAG: helix-turn-helix transcriptional regulator [Clostridia bacterium]|nr:helix-turn-helix transcriptional regulator [Clostridia bacterium]